MMSSTAPGEQVSIVGSEVLFTLPCLVELSRSSRDELRRHCLLMEAGPEGWLVLWESGQITLETFMRRVDTDHLARAGWVVVGRLIWNLL